MGIGSAYLEIQTYGATLIGVVVAVGGILGLLFAKTSKGTLISAAVLIIGYHSANAFPFCRIFLAALIMALMICR